MLKHYKFLEKISKMLDRALDAEETDTEESIDLRYEVSELLEKEIKDFEEEKVFKNAKDATLKKLTLNKKIKDLKKKIKG